MGIPIDVFCATVRNDLARVMAPAGVVYFKAVVVQLCLEPRDENPPEDIARERSQTAVLVMDGRTHRWTRLS
jgi:hypothetical protein